MVVLASVATLGGASVASAATPQVDQSSATPSAIYVDCGAAPGGDGSVASPLNTLAEANALQLVPGQQLLFERGSVCSGGLVVQSSGTTAQPIVIGAYGSGPLPQIVGTGTDAVLLQNASNVVLEDLEVTNPGTTVAKRRGVHVVADGVTVSDVTVRDLYVHDVDGDLSKDSEGSAGIELDALGTAPLGRFNGVLIAGNQVDNVSRSGIAVEGTQAEGRPPASQAWPAGSTGVVVRDNQVAHVAGDGIVSIGTVGAVLAGNVVTDGNRAGTSYTSPNAICDAGIWAWDANSTIIQGNQVTHMEFNGCDGVAYDVDYNQDGTVIQDNYSYDNAGGFILLCTDPENRTAEVRYNLSVDDATTFNEAPCDILGGGVGTLNGISMDNNTFVSPSPKVTLELQPLQSLLAPGNFAFQNNIIDATTAQKSAIPCGSHCSNNLFFRVPPSGAHPVVGAPRFTNPNAPQGTNRLANGRGFRLMRTSPAIGAGVSVSGGATKDYFGDPVPRGVPPTIGFFQSSLAKPTTPSGSVLGPGKTLAPDQSLVAGPFRLTMQKSDGNLVEYADGHALWSSGTTGHPGAQLFMQKDGNLVIYNARHTTALWDTGTAGHPGAMLFLQGDDDGNVVVYNAVHTKALWASEVHPAPLL